MTLALCMTLSLDEYELVRQAVRNQNDEERNSASRVECGNCRARQMEDVKRRSRLRNEALKKIRPEGGQP